MLSAIFDIFIITTPLPLHYPIFFHFLQIVQYVVTERQGNIMEQTVAMAAKVSSEEVSGKIINISAGGITCTNNNKGITSDIQTL